jgi:hypothetical protein
LKWKPKIHHGIHKNLTLSKNRTEFHPVQILFLEDPLQMGISPADSYLNQISHTNMAMLSNGKLSAHKVIKDARINVLVCSKPWIQVEGKQQTAFMRIEPNDP